MQSFAKHAIIVSQQFSSVAEKSLAVLNNVINHAEAVQICIKNKGKLLT
jgi:orotate phosphoribosyltransferase-like protein